jgi:hypothetical protein
MSHRETTVDVNEMEKQEALDLLVASGRPLPEEGNEYLALYKVLGSASARLPSNFSHIVMQRISRLKVESARSSALSQSVLVSFLACLLGAGLLVLYSIYTQTPMIENLSFSSLNSMLLPLGVGFILLMLIVFDGLYASVSDRTRV